MRVSNLSANEYIFYNVAPKHNKVLEDSGYKNEI